MKGKVLDFNEEKKEGIILAKQGDRYTFVSQEWKSDQSKIKAGVEVDFVENEGTAQQIYTTNVSTFDIDNIDAKNILQCYTDAFKKYATFSGITSRSGFWYFQLVSFIVVILLSIISMGALAPVYSLVILIPALAIGARRLHDTGKSGWWQLLMFIPIIGMIILFIFWIKKSQKENNHFIIN